MNAIIIKLKNYFITGFIITIPLIVTIYIMWFIFDLIEGILKPFLTLIGINIPGLSFLIMIFLISLAGFITNYAIGRQWIVLIENVFKKIPLAKVIYSAIKQTSDTLLLKKTDFKKAVLVEFPRKGMYMIGFVTGDGIKDIQEKTAEDIVSVVVLTTPNPTTGFMVMVSKSEIKYLDMSVEEGFKMIITGGMVAPSKIDGNHQPDIDSL